MATLRKDGRWMAQARMPQGKRMAFYAATEEEAERQKTEWLNPPTPSTEPVQVQTYHDFAGYVWFPLMEASCVDSTQAKYKADYKNHIKPVMKDVPAALFKSHLPDDRAFVLTKCNEVLALMKGKGLARETRIHVKTLMVTIGNVMVSLGHAMWNPAEHVKVGGVSHKRERYMPVDKAIEVLRALDGTDIMRPVAMALCFGPREAEISALQWDRHFDRTGKELRIVSQMTKTKGRPWEERECKHGSIRNVKLNSQTIGFIERFCDLDSPWMVTKNGKWYSPETIYEDWARVRGNLGLNEWTFHDLRHAAAGMLHALGYDAFSIATILGHKRIDVTWLYTHVSPETEKTATGDLAQLLGGWSSTVDVKPDVNAEKLRLESTWRPGEDSILGQ